MGCPASSPFSANELNISAVSLCDMDQGLEAGAKPLPLIPGLDGTFQSKEGCLPWVFDDYLKSYQFDCCALSEGRLIA